MADPQAPQTIPMISPDGTSGDIPIANLNAARQAGFKVAVNMQSPDGKNGYVPAERSQEAAAKGFKMVPMNDPDSVKPSYWDALTNPVGSGAHDQGILGGIEQIGGQAMKTMASPLVHPLDTAAGIYNTVRHPLDTARGVIQNFQNDQQQGGLPLAVENATGQVLGSVEGGRIAGPIVAKAAQVAVPPLANLAGRATLLGKTPEAAYESALKPSTTLSAAERANIVQTGLDKSIPVSKSGVSRIGDLIDDLNQKIKDQISYDPNRPIDPNSVATRADIAKARFAKQVNAHPDLDAIEAARQQFLTEQGAQPGKPGIPPRPTGLLDAQGKPIMSQGTPATPPQPAPPMGAADAQTMKQGTYRVLKGKFGEQGSASVEAQKALARGLKEEIATQFPEIGKLNASESQLLDLQPVLERAVNRISNRDLGGIGTPIMAAAATAASGSPSLGLAAGVIKSVLENPMVKSRLAIAVSKGAKMPYSDALSRVAAYSDSLGSYAGSSDHSQQVDGSGPASASGGNAVPSN